MNIRDESRLGRVLEIFQLRPWPELIAAINETGPG